MTVGSTIFKFVTVEDLKRETEFFSLVERLQQKEHNNGAGKHGNGAKNPKQQREGEVVASQAEGEEVLASVDESVHVLRSETGSSVAHRNAEQETGMARVPDGLHMTHKGKEKAEQEAQVLEGGGDAPGLPIHKVMECLAGASRGTAHQGSKDGTQGDGCGGQQSGSHDAVAERLHCQHAILQTILHTQIGHSSIYCIFEVLQEPSKFFLGS